MYRFATDSPSFLYTLTCCLPFFSFVVVVVSRQVASNFIHNFRRAVSSYYTRAYSIFCDLVQLQARQTWIRKAIKKESRWGTTEKKKRTRFLPESNAKKAIIGTINSGLSISPVHEWRIVECREKIFVDAFKFQLVFQDIGWRHFECLNVKRMRSVDCWSTSLNNLICNELRFLMELLIFIDQFRLWESICEG